MQGLSKLVDGLGGVDFCVDQRTKSIHTGTVYEVGCRRFAGAEIKDYLRQRRDLPNGAQDRERHNAQFVAALIRHGISAGTFTDLDKLRTLYESAGSSVVVDTRGRSPVDLAWELRDAVDTVVGIGVPTRLGTTREGDPTGNLQPTEAAEQLFEALRNDTVGEWVATNPTATWSS